MTVETKLTVEDLESGTASTMVAERTHSPPESPPPKRPAVNLKIVTRSSSATSNLATAAGNSTHNSNSNQNIKNNYMHGKPAASAQQPQQQPQEPQVHTPSTLIGSPPALPETARQRQPSKTGSIASAPYNHANDLQMIMTIHPATALQSPLPPKTPQLTSPLSARLKSHLSRLQPSSPTIKYQNVNTTVKSTTPNGHLQLELMPIDNNCLFNSIAFLFLDRVRSKSHLIRKLLASTARTHPNTRVSEEIAVLAGEYAHAIERDQGLLGGDAELDFLAEHFQCQLVVVFVRAYTAAEIEASRELQLLNQQHQLAEKHSKQQPPLTITEIKRYGSEQLPNRAFLRRGINSYYCPISLRRSPMNFWSLNNNRQSNSVGPAPSRSAENLFNPNSDGGYNHQQYNSNTVMTVFNDKSDYLLAKVVSLCESIKERRLKPLAPLSYYRVDRHTVYSWISKAILVGAGIALVFAILILAGVKPIAF